MLNMELLQHLSIILLLSSVNLGLSSANPALLTQTVYGFLDFTTTIGNTVMVFSPQSAPPLDLPGNIGGGGMSINAIETKPIDKNDVDKNNKENSIHPTKLTAISKPTLNSEASNDKNNVKLLIKKNNPLTLSSTVQAVLPALQEQQKFNKPSIQFAISKPQLEQTEEEQEILADDDDNNNNNDNKDIAIKIDNEVERNEYDLLSREPAEYAEETYRLVNLKTDHQQNRAQQQQQRGTSHSQQNADTDKHTKKLPVGLVTKIFGDTVYNAGITTIYETSVIGTYISGKYAQVLQSSSRVLKNRKSNKNKVRPSTVTTSPTLRVLKTAAPVLPSTTTAPKSTPIAPRAVVGSFKNRANNNKINSNAGRSFKNDAPAQVIQVNAVTTAKTTTENSSSGGFKKSRTGGKSKRRKNTNNNNSSRGATTTSQKESTPTRKYQQKIQHSPVEANSGTSSTSLYMFKLNRTPGRWQYKTSPKPRVAIRKSEQQTAPVTANNNPLMNNAGNSVSSIADALNQHENAEQQQNAILDQGDLESSGSESSGNNVNNINDPDQIQKHFVETLNVDISTPADFNDTYYEIATIKTPFTFQAGHVKKTRFITVTSTIEKVLRSEPVSATAAYNDNKPLIENILDTHGGSSKSTDNLILDGSITTLSALYVTDDIETPSLETITETFSIVQTKLRTQVLPIIFEQRNETSYSTLIHTYDFTSLILATKTLSPFDDSQFLPTKNFKDFGGNLDEAGSEINLELEFGDENPDDVKNDGNIDAAAKKADNKGIVLAPPSHSLIQDHLQQHQQQQQLALLNLYNQNGRPNNVITNTVPVVKLETLWESHVVPVINAGTTNFRTLSKSVGVVDKTEYRLETTTLPMLNSPQPPPITQNPYLLPNLPEIYQTITNSVVQETITTAINSKVLKLTFGARTAYTTIFSTRVVPTAVTMYLTTSVPVQATAQPAFPGYYPPPYPPFAYVG